MCGEGLVRGAGRQSLGIPSLFLFWDSCTIFRVRGFSAYLFWFPSCPISAVCAMDCNQPQAKTSGTGGMSATSHPPSESTLSPRASCLCPLFIDKVAGLVLAQTLGLWLSCCFPCVVRGSLRRRHTVGDSPLALPFWDSSILFTLRRSQLYLEDSPGQKNEAFPCELLITPQSRLCLAPS